MKEPIIYLNYFIPEWFDAVLPHFEHNAHVTITWLIMIGLAVLVVIARGALSLSPTGLHNFLEAVIVGLYDFSDQVMGKEGRPYFPLIGTLAFFILSANLIGLIPGFISPTSNINTNVAMGLTVFFLYQFVGLRKHGVVNYIKHFMGPVWWLAPIMFPIEIISHLARPLTLAFRLFGNIRGEELVILVLGFMIPLFLPIPMLAFAIFTSFLQTLVFILLTMVYISLALEESH
jgi:F-type H+-transporting ATPase subunit a